MSTRTALITVVEGQDRMLVGYPSWRAWKEDRQRPPLPTVRLVPAGSASCATCWGAGRIYEPAMNGEGLIPRTCERCDGYGLVNGALPAAA